MAKFEDIIRSEKKRDHTVENKDLFVFSTLMQIVQEQTSLRLKRRLIIGSILCIFIVIAIPQIMLLSGLTFSSVLAMIAQFNNEYPHAITLGNFGLVIIILAARWLKLV